MASKETEKVKQQIWAYTRNQLIARYKEILGEQYDMSRPGGCFDSRVILNNDILLGFITERAEELGIELPGYEEKTTLVWDDDDVDYDAQSLIDKARSEAVPVRTIEVEVCQTLHRMATVTLKLPIADPNNLTEEESCRMLDLAPEAAEAQLDWDKIPGNPEYEIDSFTVVDED